MICNVFFVVLWGTLLRPTAEAVVSIRKPPTRQNVPCLYMCEHAGDVLSDFVLAFHRNICRQHSLIVRRNYLMTEDANSLSAAAGPELSKTRILSSI